MKKKKETGYKMLRITPAKHVHRQARGIIILHEVWVSDRQDSDRMMGQPCATMTSSIILVKKTKMLTNAHVHTSGQTGSKYVLADILGRTESKDLSI